MDKYTCGTLKLDHPTTLGDIQHTINVLHEAVGWYQVGKQVEWPYTQAIAGLEFIRLSGVQAVERPKDWYVSTTSSDDFDLYHWKSIFRYQLWDCFVSYLHADEALDKPRESFGSSLYARNLRKESVICNLISVRMQLDKRIEVERGRDDMVWKIGQGIGLGYRELFHGLYARTRHMVRWNVVAPIRHRIKKWGREVHRVIQR